MMRACPPPQVDRMQPLITTHEPTPQLLYQGPRRRNTRQTGPCRLFWLAVAGLAVTMLATAPASAGPPGKGGCQKPLASKRIVLSPWGSVRRLQGGAQSWADPSSFAIGPDGSVTILSPDAARLLVFRPDGQVVTVFLPEDSSFEDLVSHKGEMLLLSRAGSRRGVFQLEQDGSIGRVPGWPDEDVPDPGLVTALESWRQDVWAIVEDEYAVRVSGPAAESTDILPGTFPDPGGVLRAMVSDSEITIFSSPVASGAPLELVRWPLRPGLHALHLVARLDDGRILALLSSDGEQRSPEVPPDVTGLLLTGMPGQSRPCETVIRWDAQGAPPFEPLRRARNTDGRIYYWRASRHGVEIRLLQP